MNLIQLTITKQALRKSLSEYERIVVCCHSCMNYGMTHAKECSVHKATPPPEWMTGPIECESWVHDSIPF